VRPRYVPPLPPPPANTRPCTCAQNARRNTPPALPVLCLWAQGCNAGSRLLWQRIAKPALHPHPQLCCFLDAAAVHATNTRPRQAMRAAGLGDLVGTADPGVMGTAFMQDLSSRYHYADFAG